MSAGNLKLPGLYVDSVILDVDTTRPVIINRDPEPYETDVPTGTLVCFEVVDFGADGIDLANTQVWIDEQLAFAAGVFQSGFDGASSAYVNTADTLKITVHVPNGFVSLSRVRVRCASQVVGGAHTIDQTWYYTIEDVTRPMISNVVAIAPRVVRVTYSQPMLPPGLNYSQVLGSLPWGDEALTYDGTLRRWIFEPLAHCYQQSNAELYVLWAGAQLHVNVNGQTTTVVFIEGDAVDLHATTAAEVAQAINTKAAGVLWAEAYLNRVWLYAVDTSSTATLQVVAGSANTALGFSTAVVGRRLPYLWAEGTYTVGITATLADGRVSYREASVALLHDSDQFILPPADETIDSATALLAANYSVARLGFDVQPDARNAHGKQPVADVTVSGVAAVSGNSSQFDLALNWEATPQGLYTLTVAGVADASGNVIASPHDNMQFAGYLPESPEGRRFSIWSNMMSTFDRTNDRTGDLARFTAVLQEVLDWMLYLVDRFGDTWDIEKADEQYLDAMLADLGNPFPFVLTETMKRRLLANLVYFYRYKGTEQIIIAAVKFFFGLDPVTITEANTSGWILGVSELAGIDAGTGEVTGETVLGPSRRWNLYAYDITVAQTLTTDQRDGIRWVAEYLQPAPCHLHNIVEPTTAEVEQQWVLGVSELAGTDAISGEVEGGTVLSE